VGRVNLQRHEVPLWSLLLIVILFCNPLVAGSMPRSLVFSVGMMIKYLHIYIVKFLWMSIHICPANMDLFAWPNTTLFSELRVISDHESAGCLD
jgi:hypothetical protein